MKTEAWLKASVSRLKSAGIATARLDCLVLLEDITEKDRAFLLARPEHELTDRQLKTLKKQMEKREMHIPLAQIRGNTEFYGRGFIIDEYVLEPRPESETMIELLLELKLPKKPVIADIGTGSGALGITTKLENPSAAVFLSDIDEKCLAIAGKNAKKHAVDVGIIKSDLLKNLPPAHVLLANLPYVPDSYEINQAALNEPRIAIFGGEDGLSLYRKLFSQINGISDSAKPRYVLTESLPFQHEELRKIADQADYKQHAEEDFIQVFEKI